RKRFDVMVWSIPRIADRAGSLASLSTRGRCRVGWAHVGDSRDRSSKTITTVDAAAPGVPMRRRGEACVVVLYGPELGKRAAIGRSAFQIGRSSKNELPIDQESVSRHHARITSSTSQQKSGYWIEDLGSTNGTWINDERVTAKRPLKDGDQIRVGRSILKFMS